MGRAARLKVRQRIAKLKDMDFEQRRVFLSRLKEEAQRAILQHWNAQAWGPLVPIDEKAPIGLLNG